MHDFYAAQLHARQIEEETGLSLADQAAMPLDEWARLAYGQTPVQAAIAALDAQSVGSTPAAAPAQGAPDAPQQPARAPEGIDPDSAEHFHAWRAQRARGGEGVGIFDSVDSRSDAYAAAVRSQAGRGALSNANVREAPRLTGRYLDHDAQRDTRTTAQRLSTPGNANTF
jgi:hypothetical protein